MTNLCYDVLKSLKGKTLVTAESCTGGGIGMELTTVSGSSAVYKGGVICYTNEVKENVLGVSREILERYGAVSAPVAAAMASGVRKLLNADVAVSVTGLAGPGGDERGTSVGTVFVGYEDEKQSFVEEFLFTGNRSTVRSRSIAAALNIVLVNNTDDYFDDDFDDEVE